jgi:hypothetical protein
LAIDASTTASPRKAMIGLPGISFRKVWIPYHHHGRLQLVDFPIVEDGFPEYEQGREPEQHDRGGLQVDDLTERRTS